ncbi:MAG: hypothetical protein A6F71_07240 [Cycloclasticus sp. symbiont of Poecilosclerida sp. M]|nr:MAG: hypothetical protein A6F71_07240 [Cycloclasticus sp. symbiont of Poecilosclerida sp. M]
MNNKIIAGAVAAAVIGMSPITASAINFKDVMAGKADFSIGGYLKLNAINSDYSAGDVADTTGGNAFYFPGRIPTDVDGGGAGSGENSDDLDFSAQESRINFKVSQKIDGHSLLGYLEIDFMPVSGAGTAGNEIISNSTNPRLRHAFFKFDNWLFGQTWSTYMDVGSLPESVDFLAASESVVFNRQPQIRYTSGAFQIALENPEAFNNGGTDRDDSDLPDLTANYTMKGDFGHVRLSGLLREVVDIRLATAATAATPATSTALATLATPAIPATDESEIGYGIGLTGKFNVGKDDLKYSFQYGEGLGRYVGLALPADGTVDANGDLNLSTTTAFTLAYRHWWTDKVRSSLIYSDLDVDYDSAVPVTSTSSSESITVNLMYSPVKNVTLGVMYLYAERELDNGEDGNLTRLHASAKYAF